MIGEVAPPLVGQGHQPNLAPRRGQRRCGSGGPESGSPGFPCVLREACSLMASRSSLRFAALTITGGDESARRAYQRLLTPSQTCQPG